MSPAVKRNNALIKRNKILASMETHKTIRQLALATGMTEHYVTEALRLMCVDNKAALTKPASRKRKEPYEYVATGQPYALLFDKPKVFVYPALDDRYKVTETPLRGRDVRLEDYADAYRDSQKERNKQRIKQNVWIASTAAMV